MDDSTSFQEKLGEALRSNKLAIFLEIALVVVVLYASLLISDQLGSDITPLGDNYVLLGSPLAYLGLALTLAIVWATSRMRGVGWGEYGTARPASWIRTVLLSFGVALVILSAIVMLVNPLSAAFGPRDMSRFEVLRDNLPTLIINLVAMWFTAGFVEEFLWRGYLMTRMVDLFGKQKKLAWVIALIGSAIIFGVAHSYQGLAGVVKTGAVGLLFGIAFLTLRRNLWPLIIAHALIDTMDFVIHYFGG